MNQDQRDTQPPIPANPSDYLTNSQIDSLSRIKHCGWQLAFIRRNIKEKSLPFIASANGYQMGFIEADGHINLTSGIKIRSDVDGGLRNSLTSVFQHRAPTSMN